jgi:hypothetical protein
VQGQLLLDEKDNNKKDIKVREIMRGEDALHVSLSKVFPGAKRTEGTVPVAVESEFQRKGFERIEEDSILLVLLPLATTTRC